MSETLSVSEVAELHGCHVQTVRRAIDRGDLTAERDRKTGPFKIPMKGEKGAKKWEPRTGGRPPSGNPRREYYLQVALNEGELSKLDGMANHRESRAEVARRCIFGYD